MTRHFYLQVLPTFFVLVDILVKVKQLLLLNLDTQEGTYCHLLSKILVYYFFYFQDLCDFTNGQLLWMQTRVSCLLMLHYARVFNQNWIVSVTNPKKRLTSSPPQIEVNVQHPTSKMCYKKVFFIKMGHPRPLFVYFRSFQTIYRIKTVDFSGIRTRIVRVEGENADHSTTTTAHGLQESYHNTILLYRWQYLSQCLGKQSQIVYASVWPLLF